MRLLTANNNNYNAKNFHDSPNSFIPYEYFFEKTFFIIIYLHLISNNVYMNKTSITWVLSAFLGKWMTWSEWSWNHCLGVSKRNPQSAGTLQKYVCSKTKIIHKKKYTAYFHLMTYITLCVQFLKIYNVFVCISRYGRGQNWQEELKTTMYNKNVFYFIRLLQLE